MDRQKIFQNYVLAPFTAMLIVMLLAGPARAQGPETMTDLFGTLDQSEWEAARETITLLDWARWFLAEYFGVEDSGQPSGGGGGSSSIDLTGRVEELLSPVETTLTNFETVAGGDYETTASNLFGVNWNLAVTTTQAYEAQTAAADYYNDDSIPDELRDVGYSLEEGLSTVDTATMSPIDYASYLGAVVAIPFLYVRGFQEIASFLGPIGLFITWLIIAAIWVTLVNFLSFLLSTASTIFSIGSRILELIGLVKP